LLNSLFFFRDSIFPVVAPVLADEGSLLGRRKARIVAEGLAESEGRAHFVFGLFELVEEGG